MNVTAPASATSAVTRTAVAGSPSITVSDAELVRRVLEGDVRAFELVVDRHQPMLGRFARHMLGNAADAEEVVQDTFVRAYRGLANCRDPERLGSWLLAILANRCRSWLRRRWWRERRVAHLGDGRRSDGADVAQRVAWRDAIERALTRLDTRQREAFLLHHVEGLSYDEMARVTGAGVSALKMRVKRACDQLRHQLEEDADE